VLQARQHKSTNRASANQHDRVARCNARATRSVQADGKWLRETRVIVRQVRGNWHKRGCGHCNELGHSAVAIQAMSDIFEAKIGPALGASGTRTARNSCPRRDAVAHREAGHSVAEFHDLTNKFVAENHRPH
jgi:hypothetical protein